jgi:hypothetical protein
MQLWQMDIVGGIFLNPRMNPRVKLEPVEAKAHRRVIRRPDQFNLGLKVWIAHRPIGNMLLGATTGRTGSHDWTDP